MARGSVGDVTMYRMDGEQVARARNRHPNNPNSVKQAIQRAITASVSRLYSLTQTLTDHAFQGKSQGKENQRVFLKRNQAILRSLVITALNDNLADNATNARVSAPGLNVAVPFVGAQMSSGTYDQQLFAYDSSVFGYKLPAPASAEETVAEYAARLGLVAGDIYTFVAIGVDSNSASPLYSLAISNPYASVYQPTFGYVQLMVKSGLSDDTNPITGKTFADLFTQAGGTTDITYLAVTADVSIDDINTTGSDHGCITCIRSRWDQDLRSTSFLMAGTSEMAYGLTPAYLLAAWRDKLGIDNVELILEGERFSGISESDALVINGTAISGIRNLTAWPTDEPVEKLYDDADTEIRVVVSGQGINSIAMYKAATEDGDRSEESMVNTEYVGDTAAMIIFPKEIKYWWLYVNGEQYGSYVRFTE